MPSCTLGVLAVLALSQPSVAQVRGPLLPADTFIQAASLQQPRPQPPRPPATPTVPAARPALSLRASGHVGYASFSAQDSLKAVYGSSGGLMAGGSLQLAHRRGWFAEGRVSWFRATGERVFVNQGQVFPLGIGTTLTLLPVDVVGGWRFLPRPRPAPRPPLPPAPGSRQPPARPAPPAPVRAPRRIVPYIGGGVGVVQMREESDLAGDDERVSERKTSLVLVGGVEFPIRGPLNGALEAGWRRVADALSETPLAEEFGETNLDHVFLNFRIIFGR